MAELIITIDGPAGAGKSTVARLVAEKIGAGFLDTGAMYRAVTLAAMRAGCRLDDADSVLTLMENTVFEFEYQDGIMKVFVNGVDVADEIRSPEVTEKVYHIASEPKLRARLVEMQRQFADSQKKIVTEGRDQGTVVFPEADVKIFLVADEAERAGRRQAELSEKGIEKSIEKIVDTIRQRDSRDSSRSTGPLKPAEDSVRIDTTNLSVESVVEKIICQIINRLKNKK